MASENCPAAVVLSALFHSVLLCGVTTTSTPMDTGQLHGTPSDAPGLHRILKKDRNTHDQEIHIGAGAHSDNIASQQGSAEGNYFPRQSGTLTYEFDVDELLSVRA